MELSGLLLNNENNNDDSIRKALKEAIDQCMGYLSSKYKF
jgi:aerobic-type carbon monoxide dehydrogenase small subunit (CoxS/CutS family)